MRIERRLGIRSAYGQLVLLVFLPIAILATVGGVLVFFETTRTIKSEQDTLAQAALIRYQPIVYPLLSQLKEQDYLTLQEQIRPFGDNGMTEALIPNEHSPNFGKRYVIDKMHQLQSEQHIMRVGILDAQGTPLMAVGFNKEADWGEFDTTADSVWRLPTSVGTAYGMPIYADVDGVRQRFWLLVDMDNEPLTISYYRILLALAITGLITILMLLLVLNLYSKRWISPVYEMRLFLQKLNADNLHKNLATKTDGELYLLQKELNLSLRRLNSSFKELKSHSEQTETDLQLAFDEMEMQNISIRKARDEAILASQTKSAFLANISHELRTPLNAIDGFINLLARSKTLDSKQTLYVQTIQKSSAHLLALINDVLDFSKIEAKKLALESYEFDLYDTVYEVADMLSPTALDKGLRFSVMIYQDVPTKFVGDRLRIKQILTNLVGNAVKFTDRGGVTITLSIDDSQDETYLKVLVADTGRGIDKAIFDQLFQSFGQGDLSITRRYGGTGLGLAISKELVSLMNGEIGFFDNSDAGTDSVGASFWFKLPTVQSDFAQISAPKSLENARILAWLSHQPSMQVLKSSLLMTQMPLQFDEAKSLAQLLETLSDKTNSYDWVIADSFGQHGDISALLNQIRSHYQGNLMVYGFEIGLNSKVLEEYGVVALHEPIDRRKLYATFDNKPQKQPEKSVNYQGITVLAVDDHKPNLLVLEALLGELSVQVVQVESGFAAIERMEQSFERGGDIDLIFMDIQMPTMSGIQAAASIRKLESACTICKPVPIIALSAHGLWSDMDSLYKAGINDYATKPIARQPLMDLLQKWLFDKELPRPEHTAAEEPPCFDWQDALERASGNDALAKKLLTMLLANIDKEKIALEMAWAERNKTALYEVVHRILGATRYTGVPRLRIACEQLHEQLQEDGVSLETLEPSYQKTLQNLIELEEQQSTLGEFLW